MRLFDELPEVSEEALRALGSKSPTTDYVPLHDGYDKHKMIFPKRPGPAPTTTTWEPHEQLDQIGPDAFWDELWNRALALPGVSEHDSKISVKGARALWLDEDLRKGPPESFVWEEEFAHIHPRPDSSWHLQLPLELAVFAIDAGWAEIHTTCWLGDAPANSVMLFSPRNAQELEVIWDLIEESYRFATGQESQFEVTPHIEA